MWWYNWRYLPHMKDEALAPNPNVMEQCPIANPSDAIRSNIESDVGRLVEIFKNQNSSIYQLLDWLKVEFDISEPSTRLQRPTDLDSDAFVAQVQKLRGKKKSL